MAQTTEKIINYPEDHLSYKIITSALRQAHKNTHNIGVTKYSELLNEIVRMNIKPCDTHFNWKSESCIKCKLSLCNCDKTFLENNECVCNILIV